MTTSKKGVNKTTTVRAYTLPVDRHNASNNALSAPNVPFVTIAEQSAGIRDVEKLSEKCSFDDHRVKVSRIFAAVTKRLANALFDEQTQQITGHPLAIGHSLATLFRSARSC